MCTLVVVTMILGIFNVMSASGVRDGKRAAGSWEAAAFWMQMLGFFLSLKTSSFQTIQKLHIYDTDFL